MNNSYAVIETGGKQYRVSPGDTLDVELLENQQQVTFKNVLLFADGGTVEVGTPYLKGAAVTARVKGTNKDDKVTTFKYKNKTNYHRTIGHRQNYTRIEIEEIKHGA
jgi:large subunit ribosomal protein L21